MRARFLVAKSFAFTFAVAALASADPQAGGGVPPGPPVGPAPSASAATTARVVAPPPPLPPAGPTAPPSRGAAAYLARDFPAALSAFKEALGKDATDATAYYLLGEAELAAGHVADADASFAAGLRNAGTNDEIHGKLLFVVADLRERQGRWPDAKKAWEEYAQFLNTHPNVKGYAATATERVKVIDGHVDLDAKYAPVKQRIEQRLKENAAAPPPPNERPAPPPAKKK